MKTESMTLLRPATSHALRLLALSVAALASTLGHAQVMDLGSGALAW